MCLKFEKADAVFKITFRNFSVAIFWVSKRNPIHAKFTYILITTKAGGFKSIISVSDKNQYIDNMAYKDKWHLKEGHQNLLSADEMNEK